MFYLKKYYIVFIAILAFLVLFLFYSSSMKVKTKFSFIDQSIQFITKPFELVIDVTKGSGYSLFHSYVLLFKAREEADTLKEENSKLRGEIQIFSDLKEENKRLRQLLGFAEKSNTKFLVSEVVAGDPSFIYKSIRISKGQKDGVQPGMGVLSALGVVGVVMRTSSRFSDVLLLNDPNMNMDVLVARNRRRGILQTRNSRIMQFKYIWYGSRIYIGDKVVTSGLSGAFPIGILVGHVSKIEPSDDGLSERIEVTPSVHFENLTEVLVLLSPNRTVDVIGEIAGQEWIKRLFDSNQISDE